MTDWLRKHSVFPRLLVVWAAWLITTVVLAVLDVELFGKLGAAQATFLTAVIGILATVVGVLERWNIR